MFKEETQMICEKNDILQKVTKCSINIPGMLNILHKIFKYTIATCNVNSYQTFCKMTSVSLTLSTA